MDSAIHCGDNLEILAAMPPASVHLCYIDPPFNSGRTHSAASKKSGKMLSFDDKFRSVGDYIEWMRPRCEQIRRVLAPDGSFYLHCDPTAGAYLGVMCDEVFGINNHRAKIVWARAPGGKNGNKKSFGCAHDTILCYAPEHSTWNPPAGELTDFWGDIKLHSTTKERLGYPTQKPLALLERIVSLSSNPGDVVLDAFCGSGTTCEAARRLGRRWIGIDRSPDAVEMARERLARPLPEVPRSKVIPEPKRAIRAVQGTMFDGTDAAGGATEMGGRTMLARGTKRHAGAGSNDGFGRVHLQRGRGHSGQ